VSFEIGKTLGTNEPNFSIEYLSRPVFGHRVIKTFTIKDKISLAYVLGVLKGDGCLANRKRSHYFIDLQVKDKDFAKNFAEALSKVLNENVTFKTLRRSTIRGIFDGYEVCKGHKGFYLWYKRHESNTISIIESLGPRAISLFLRGFFDSEGSPQKCTASIRLYNKDIPLLESIQRLLLKYFQIPSKILSYSHTHPFLVIYGWRSFKHFSEHIGFSIERKQKRLNLLVAQVRRQSYE